MTVEELISRLSEMPTSAEVWAEGLGGLYEVSVSVEIDGDGVTYVLISDCAGHGDA